MRYKIVARNYILTTIQVDHLILIRFGYCNFTFNTNLVYLKEFLHYVI